MARSLTRLMWVVAFVSIGVPAAAQTPTPAATVQTGHAIDPEFRADIERLFEMTGGFARGAQLASLASDAFLNGLRQTMPSIPPRLIEIVREVLNSEFDRAFN